MDLCDAICISSEIIHLLKPHCSRIEVAGSVRRKSKRVKDIEIVCLRKPSELYFFKEKVDRWFAVKGEATGKYTQRIYDKKHSPEEDAAVIDLFMPSPDDYYRQLAIRTGPADFSHHVIAYGWKKKGWVGTENGLRKKVDSYQSGDKWICKRNDPVLPPAWQSEEEFFKWLGMEYLVPEERGLVAISH